MDTPGYSQDQFLRLMAAIEEDGGYQTEDEEGVPMRCSAREYNFVGPKSKPRVLPGCGNESIFDVAFDPTTPIRMDLPVYQYNKAGEVMRDSFTGDPVVLRVEQIDHPGEPGPLALQRTVQVCAVEDGLGWWPRYAHVMEDE